MNTTNATDTAMDLKLMPCDSPNVFVLTGGLNTFNDGLGGWYYWNDTSTTTPNDVTVIQVTGVTTGRWLSASSNTTQGPVYYGSAGVSLRPVKVWRDIVTPSSANGYSIDISSAGFSTILSVNVNIIANIGTANSIPYVTVKSYTTSAVVVNIITGNSAIVSILSINVLSGFPLIFASSLTGITLSVHVTGY